MSPASTMAPGRALGSGLADRYGHVRVLWTPFEQRPHCRAGRLRRCGYVVAPFPEARARIYHIVWDWILCLSIVWKSRKSWQTGITMKSCCKGQHDRDIGLSTAAREGPVANSWGLTSALHCIAFQESRNFARLSGDGWGVEMKHALQPVDLLIAMSEVEFDGQTGPATLQHWCHVRALATEATG